MFSPTRTVTTGIENEESKLISDTQIKTIIPYPKYPSFQLQDLFYTEDNPQSLSTAHKDNVYSIDLPIGSMRFLKVRMPTKAEIISDLKNCNEAIPNDWKKFNLHSTDSVDYIYILSGKITCVVGEQLIHLEEGDFLAQIGAEHTWINDNDAPCYILCVMVGIAKNPKRKKMDVE